MRMVEDWEAEFLSTRHVHNRGSRKSTSKKTNQGTFDVKNTFGSYDLKCPSAERIRNTSNTPASDAESTDPKEKKARKQKKKRRRNDALSMDVYRLTDDGTGLAGSLTLPGVLEAGIILAATRKGLEGLRHDIESQEDGGLGEDPSQGIDSSSNTADTEAAENRTDSEAGSPGADFSLSKEEKEKQRFEQFEKNSFRQPKFWFWWKGMVLTPGALAGEEDKVEKGHDHSGLGYVVFSGSSCKRFEGTLSCEELGWKDVAFSGWKTASMKERDVEIM